MAKEKEIKTEGAAQEVQSTGGGGNATETTTGTTASTEGAEGNGSSATSEPSEGTKPVDEGSATTLSARDAYRQRIKEDNPDLDIDDEEAYYAAANKRYDDYKMMRDGIEQLNNTIDKNVLFRKMMVAASEGGEDWNPYKWMIDEGFDPSELAKDPEYADKFAEAQKKHLKEVAEGEKMKEEAGVNYQASTQAIDEYCKANGISDEDKNAAWERIYQMLNDANVGKVSTDLFALLVQGANHDKDVAQAEEEGRQEGLSTKITDQLRKMKKPEGNLGRQMPEPQPKPQKKSNNMFVG